MNPEESQDLTSQLNQLKALFTERMGRQDQSLARLERSVNGDGEDRVGLHERVRSLEKFQQLCVKWFWLAAGAVVVEIVAGAAIVLIYLARVVKL